MLDDSPKDDLPPGTSGPVSSTPPPTPSEAASPSGALFASSDPLVGKVLLDRVRIVRPIARGGMGKVYLGEQTKMKRRCAVKVLDPRLAGGGDAADFTRRFLLEASVAAKLAHPHVVTIFDYGETPDGCFIAMEYLQGRSLSEELKGGRLGAERAVHIAKQVCRALREAHAQGIVHRDIKPGNIYLLKQDDDDDFVKVLDFGLVHDSKSTEGREHAGTDAIMGSPRYMAPEQVQGKEVDGRADIYSLGAVLYATLTGHPPFERRTELATMMAQVSDPVPSMQTTAPDLVLPAGLEAIVLRCLAKNPDERWGSMDELLAVLQDRGAPPAEAAPPAAHVLPDPDAFHFRSSIAVPEAPRGNRMGVVAAVVAAVAVVAVAVLRLFPGQDANVSTTVAAAPPAPTVLAPKATATLHVETDPPGAKVNEEGETMCPATPCDIVYVGDGADPGADHLLAFLLPGYKLERKVTTVGTPVSVKLTKAH
jgi:tRNA A-37 threonylcarbamoyl transferase component Bud32